MGLAKTWLEHLVWVLVLSTSHARSKNANSSSSNRPLFIEKVDDYPSNDIKQALSKRLKIQSIPPLFNISFEFTKNPIYTTSSINRFGIASESDLSSSQQITNVFGVLRDEDGNVETPVCETTIDEIQPQKGRAKDGTYKIIVNEKVYQQKLYIQKCKHVDQPCSEIQADLRSNYQSVCKQRYADVVLLTYQNGDVKQDKFTLPVSCDCYIKSYLF